MRLITVLIAGSFMVTTPAAAFKKLDGYFIAFETCEAYHSKNRLTNPGDITTLPSVAYKMLGLNKEGGDYFQVQMDDAPVSNARWVSTDCGVHVVEADTRTRGTGSDGSNDVIEQEGTESVDNLLTLSWQPAFCEIRPGKKECRDLNDGLLPHTTRQLSIHGLWPQPKDNIYCGVPANIIDLDKPDTWDRLPAPAIDTETADALRAAMPGYASFLHHHEWIKHGTCFLGEDGADEYYDDTLYLTELVNQSAVGDLFFNNVGAEITGAEIRAAFDASFGQGTGDRVLIKCTNDGSRTLINEIWLGMKGKITRESDLGELMLAADTVAMGCSRGTIDMTGLQ